MSSNFHARQSDEPILAVIFDKDGTLHDTEKVFLRAWRLAAEELQVPDIDATIVACTGKNIPDIARYWHEKYPSIPFDAYLPRRQYHFHRIIGEEGVPVKAGAHEMLSYLKEKNIKIGMATSSPYDEVVAQLQETQMLAYFDTIVTGDMVKNGKPHPECYLMAAKALDVMPKNCIGVEDSLNGVRAVVNAGMRAVMIPDMIKPTQDILAQAWQVCKDMGALHELLAHCL